MTIISENVALITGASGLLGRAVYDKFKSSTQFNKVLGLAFSRATDELIKLDLTDFEALSKFIDENKPKVIIHCAAERRPDVSERDPEKTIELNVETSKKIAALALKYKTKLVYISTDYVFDGTSPPYAENDIPNPLNFYGKSKLAGEKAVHQFNPKAIVLRIPVLYGETITFEESAINILINAVKNSSKTIIMDHHAARFPTNVFDIASVCLEIAECTEELPSILHYSASEKFTKYEMSLILAEILNITDISHLEPEIKVSESQVSRPENTQLSTEKINSFGIGKLKATEFKTWFTKYLSEQ